MQVNIDDRLIERGFGELDTTKVTNYNYVWPLDLYDSHHTAFGVESVNSVVERVRDLITDLEARYSGKNIVLTSHADTLQIMQCFVAEIDPRLFSQYRFRNAEVRSLLQEPTSMPQPAPLCKIAPASELIRSSVLRDDSLDEKGAAPSPSGGSSDDEVAEKLVQLSQLYVDGKLTEDEFVKAKQIVLR